MAATFQLLDYCLFVAVLFISALIGIYYLLKEKWMAKAATSDDILMGGREMHLFPVAMSLVASYMSAITVLGIPTEMYVFGTQYWLVALSGFMTYPVTCHVFLPFFHNLQLASAYQVRNELHRVKICFNVSKKKKKKKNKTREKQDADQPVHSRSLISVTVI